MSLSRSTKVESIQEKCIGMWNRLSVLSRQVRLTFLLCLVLLLYIAVTGPFQVDSKQILILVKDKETLQTSLNISKERKLRDETYLRYIAAMGNKDNLERKQRFPDVIGIGAEKCGTGALRWMLLRHPMIKSSNPAEVHFFGSKKYQNGMEYYKTFMPEVTDSELVFEKTPSYFMGSEETPSLIKRNLPNAKLIAILCDPVNRTFSDFVQEIEMKNIPQNAQFETVVSQQMQIVSRGMMGKRTDDAAAIDYIHTAFKLHRQTHLLTTGLYYYHLKRWFKEYNSSSIHIIDGEELITNPGGVMEKVQEFLGIPKLIIAEDFVKGESGFYCISAPMMRHSPDGVILSPKKPPHCLGAGKGRTRMGNWQYKPTKSAIQLLKRFYAPYNLMLFNLMKRNFTWQQDV